MSATICFSYLFLEKAEKDWDIRVDQTAERFRVRCWHGWKKAMLPYPDRWRWSKTPRQSNRSEFLNAFESMQSRSTTVLLDEASLVRFNRLGRWQVDITSDTLGYPGRYVTLADVAQSLSLAAKRPNQFTLSPPFRSERGQIISAIALSFRNLGSDDRSRNAKLRYPI